MRDLFRSYVDSRIEIYRRLPDIAAARVELANSQRLQGEIWTAAVAATRDQPPPAAMLLLPALNEMIDITSTRTMATQMHPPPVIYAMLCVVSLAGALLAGYGMAGAPVRNWFHILSFRAIMAVTVYVILNLEFPRLGIIGLDSFDQLMVELRRSMG
jgi:hypothetical protein